MSILEPAQRIDRKVFRLPREVHRECLAMGVSSKDIIAHYNRWKALGINSTYHVAALRALEDKKVRGVRP